MMLDLTKENLENVVLIALRKTDQAISFSTDTSGDSRKYINLHTGFKSHDDTLSGISTSAFCLIFHLIAAFTGHEFIQRQESQTGRGYKIWVREDTEEGKQIIRAHMEEVNATTS